MVALRALGRLSGAQEFASGRKYLGTDAIAIKTGPSQWSLDVLQRIEWKHIEGLCCSPCRSVGNPNPFSVGASI